VSGELGPVHIRRAHVGEAHAIAALNNRFAAEALMLPRTPEAVALSIDDYVVAVTPRGRVVGCGSLKEYSPSLAEVAAVAVDEEARCCGLGRQIVAAVEGLARKRGVREVFALTLEPAFFEALGYARTERARYPEKIRRDCAGCPRRAGCVEMCFAKRLELRAVGSRQRAA
jgi:N-acetylglutamate synthase-like GNAT family acetyltransferase